MLRRTRETGDTLIEVLFAITIFSLILVTSLSLMNQGTSAALRSLQITLARQQIDSQAEALRFLSSSYVANYQAGYTPDTSDAITTPAEEYYKIIQRIIATGATSASDFAGGTATACPAAPAGAFILNTSTASLVTSGLTLTAADTYPQVVHAGATTTAYGIWVEAVRSDFDSTSRTRYTDFHIRACWGASGSGVPMKVATIVRLYEPTPN